MAGWLVAFVAARPDGVQANEPGPLHHFEITVTGSPTAGEEITASVQAQDEFDTPIGDYDFTAADLSSTLGDAPNGTPTARDGELTENKDGWTAISSAVGYLAMDDASFTVTDGTVTTTSNTFAVLPGALASFTIDPITSPRTAGTAFTVTATAYDAYGNIKTDYTSGATLTSTLANSPNDSTPTVPTSLTWGSGTGIGAASVTAVKAQPTANQTVTVTDGTVTTTSNTFAVLPGALASFTIDPITSPRTAGTAFTVTATAYDAYGNIKTDYTSGATLTSTLANSPTTRPRPCRRPSPGGAAPASVPHR